MTEEKPADAGDASTGKAGSSKQSVLPNRQPYAQAAPSRPDFVLRLRPEAGCVDPTRSLKALLKIALRRFGMRCLDVREVEHPDHHHHHEHREK